MDDNKYKDFDLMMRSVLENAEEEVPAGIWDSVSEGLDKAAGKKTVVLMWRRAAVGFGVAAALALGLVLNHEGSSDIITPALSGSEMIAVVEKPASVVQENGFGEDVMLAYVDSKDTAVQEEAVVQRLENTHQSEEVYHQEKMHMPAEIHDETAEAAESAEAVEEEQQPSQNNLTYQYKEEYKPSDWEEPQEKKERGKVRTSLVLSGVAGTNGTRSNAQTGLLRQPTISKAPPRTGVKETSTKSIYGVPISFGAGVKIGFTDRWSVGTGLEYTLLVRDFYGSYTEVDSNGSTVVSPVSDNVRNTQHYVGIPVNVFYNIVDSRYINFYAYAGGAVEKCLKDHYRLLEAQITHVEKAKGVQLSANLGIGVEFLLGNYLGLYIDPKLRYYFDNGQPKSIRTAQPLMFGFEMGLRVRL